MQTTTTSLTYAIDPAHSEVGFAVRHLMISKVRGNFTGFSGTVSLDAGGDIPTKINGTVDATSVDTREEKRDAHLRSADFFDVENHPQITFASTSITGSGNDFSVVGDLTIRGTTKSVTLKGEVGGHTTDPWGNDRIGYSATTRINRKDFAVNFNQALETGGVMISDEVDLALEISAVLQK
jgi:polyisoprenoid-binding protein YceI